MAAGQTFGPRATPLGAVEAAAGIGERAAAAGALQIEQARFEPLPLGSDQTAGFGERKSALGGSDLRGDEQCRAVLREAGFDIEIERGTSPAAAIAGAGAAVAGDPLRIAEAGRVLGDGKGRDAVFGMVGEGHRPAKRSNWWRSVRVKKVPTSRHSTASSALSTRGEGFEGAAAICRTYSRKKT